MNHRDARRFLLSSTLVFLGFLFACAPSGTDPEPTIAPLPHELIHFDHPRQFGQLPVVAVQAVGSSLQFETAGGESYELSFDPTAGLAITAPRFRVSWREEGETLFVHEEALLDDGSSDELNLTRRVGDDDVAVESYNFNGEARSFRIAPRSSARNDFALWYEQRVGPSGLNEENNPHAAEFGSFVRSRELRLFLIGLVAASAPDLDTRQEAERVYRLVKKDGEDGSDEALDWLCGLASTCTMLKCTVGGILNPVCGVCSIITIPCVIRWWEDHMPEIQEAAENLWDSITDWMDRWF